MTDVLVGVLRPTGVVEREPARSADISHLRSPFEIPAVVFCVATNLGLVFGALLVATAGYEWMEARPMLAERKAELWAILGFALLALPAAFFGRRAKLVNVRGNGVRVSPTQVPELHAILVRECDALGMEEIPDLYLSHDLKEVAAGYAVIGERSCVVINADLLFIERWMDNLDAIAFAIGHGLGSLRLGHTRWWLEVLTGYAIRIPGLRTPVLEAYVLSCDRCAAFAVPGGIRGLLINASGKELLADVDVRSFIEQSRSFGGFWAWVSGLARRTTPHTCARVRRLYEAGFFNLEADLQRYATVP